MPEQDGQKKNSWKTIGCVILIIVLFLIIAVFAVGCSSLRGPYQSIDIAGFAGTGGAGGEGGGGSGTGKIKQSCCVDYITKYNKTVSDSEKKQYCNWTQTYSNSNNINPALTIGVINAESIFNKNAISYAGAQGLMQLMPGTAAGLGVTNAYDPEQNIRGGTKYLNQNRDQLTKWNLFNLENWIASYNAGPGAIQKYGQVPPYHDTQIYVGNVKKYMNEFIADGCVEENAAIVGNVNDLVSKMSTEELIGQMLMISAQTTGQTLKKYHIGGVIIMGGEVGYATQLKALSIPVAGTVLPLLISSDVESKNVDRLRLGLNPASSLQTSEMNKIAQAMKSNSININLAPVVDVCSSGLICNQERSFGSNPAIVKQKAQEFITAMHAQNILSVIKHYPGYGNTTGNSDLQRITNATYVTENEAVFGALKSSTDGIMMSNLGFSDYNSGVPAFASSKLVGQAKSGFNGFIITDDLPSYYGSTLGQEAADAANTGNDILLFVRVSSPTQLDGIINSMKTNVSRSRLEDAVRRILKAKQK